MEMEHSGQRCRKTCSFSPVSYSLIISGAKEFCKVIVSSHLKFCCFCFNFCPELFGNLLCFHLFVFSHFNQAARFPEGISTGSGATMSSNWCISYANQLPLRKMYEYSSPSEKNSSISSSRRGGQSSPRSE